METKREVAEQNILDEVEQVADEIDRVTMDEPTWKHLLKLRLIREILITGKQR